MYYKQRRDQIVDIGKDASLPPQKCIFANRKVYNKLIADHIRKHADEKLLRLYPEFIMTKNGKKLAEPLHREMQVILVNLDTWLEEYLDLDSEV